jgi:hypothetical protein
MKLHNLTKLEKNAAVAEVEKALAANPQAAIEFDSAAGGRANRRSKIEACLALVAARGDHASQVAELKAKVAAAKAKIAALQKAKETNAKLRSGLASAKSRLAKAPTAPVSATPLIDTFNSLTGTERTAFYRKNERAIRLESLRADCPQAITPKA